jgi:DNA-binding transcriptional ArsR family regulator
MDTSSVAALSGALANETRLAIFFFLVEWGEEGVSCQCHRKALKHRAFLTVVSPEGTE